LQLEALLEALLGMASSELFFFVEPSGVHLHEVFLDRDLLICAEMIHHVEMAPEDLPCALHAAASIITIAIIRNMWSSSIAMI
jgi:hypothetical protein